MSDPRRPYGSEPNQPRWSPPTEPLGNQNPQYTDPAYAGQFTYPSYVPPAADPTQQLPPYWTQTQYQAAGPEGPGEPPPPERPKSPRWLWLLAGAAVLLVAGLVAALVIANGSSEQDTAVAPLPPMPEPSSTTTRTPTSTTETPRTATSTPTTTRPTEAPSTPPASPGGPATTTTKTGPSETVVYSVTGPGRAISITYVDSGGVLQMEFNVVLPWSKEVTLSAPASNAASVTVLNVGRQITCTVAVDGNTVRERSGSGLTMCAAIG